jgi:hypothetical protein
MVMVEHKYGGWGEAGDTKDFRKYYRARDRVMIGCVGNSLRPYDSEQFYKLDLTSKLGLNNTFEDMVKHFKKLNRWFKAEGRDFDYCGAPEVAPKNELVYLHCCYRSNDMECLTDLHYWPTGVEVSEAWEKFHGAKIILFEPVWEKGRGQWINYMSKHIVKEYPETSKLGFRMLTSHGWLPENCELVHVILSKHTAQSIRAGDMELETAWALNEMYFKSWAEGSLIDSLYVNSKGFELKGQSMIYDGLEYPVKIGAVILGVKKVKEIEGELNGN